MPSSDVNGQFADLVQALEQMESTIDQLTETLPQDSRELFLRLMIALDVKENSPLLPIFVALQFYSEYLKSLSTQLRSVATSLLQKIPNQMKTAGDDALTKALTSYGTIQTQIDNSIGQVEAQVKKVDSIRDQWKQDTEALLPNFKGAFTVAKSEAVEAYQAEIRKQSETALQEWGQELESTRKIYLADVLKQGFIWATGASAIALLAVGGAAYWFGVQQGKANAVKEFGNQDWYTISQQMINRADNKQRLINCYNDSNPKCTVWIRDPQ